MYPSSHYRKRLFFQVQRYFKVKERNTEIKMKQFDSEILICSLTSGLTYLHCLVCCTALCTYLRNVGIFSIRYQAECEIWSLDNSDNIGEMSQMQKKSVPKNNHENKAYYPKVELLTSISFFPLHVMLNMRA